jgi:hypothetical protein
MYPSTFAYPYRPSTGQVRYTVQPPNQYQPTMVPPYPSLTSQISAVPSPIYLPPGQAHRNILQPNQQYYTTISPPSNSLVTASMPGIGGSHPFTFASPHSSSTGQARQTIQQPAEQYYTMFMLPLSAADVVVLLWLSFPITLILLKVVSAYCHLTEWQYRNSPF